MGQILYHLGAKLSKPVLEITDLKKTYSISGTRALDGATLAFYSGEIASLLGENGAGKTTLMKAIVGIEKPDSGSMLLQGEKYIPLGPYSALEKGIGMVPQSLKVISQLTVFENLLLGFRSNWPGRTIKHFKEKIEEVMQRYRLQLPLDMKVELLSTGQRQKLEVLRILQNSPGIIIFDEPTTLISETDKGELFETFRRFKAEGKTVLFITHKLYEAYSVSDRIYVIRSGAIIGRYKRDETSVEELHDLVSGEETRPDRVQLSSAGEVVLRVEELGIEGSVEGEEAVKETSFEVRRGELLAISGVPGNGQEELLEGIFGMRKILSGRVLLDGKDVTNVPPRNLRKLGLAALPSDRDGAASCKSATIKDNLVIHKVADGGWIVDDRGLDAFARSLLSDYGVLYGSIFDPASSLSGGNLQKLLLSREISSEPRALLLGEPSRGLDVKHLHILRTVLARIKEEMAVVVFTADLEEALKVGDRIIVMSEGRIVFNAVNRPGLSKHMIGKLILKATGERQ